MEDPVANFNVLSQKFSQLIYGRTEGDRSIISKCLDDLNYLDYNQEIVFNTTKAVLLINHCCTLVPPDDPSLISKCCQLITNLINKQNVLVEGRTLSLALEWCFQALKQDVKIAVDVLLTVDALIRTNKESLIIENVLNSSNPLLSLAMNENHPEVVLVAVQCLETYTHFPENSQKSNIEKCSRYLELCAKIFLKYLLNKKSTSFVDELLYLKLLISCLRGLQNVILKNNEFLINEVGILLGIVKSYMIYGISNINFTLPQKLLPSVLNIPEANVVPREKKGGKIAKQRKHRTSTSKKDATKNVELLNETASYNSYSPANESMESQFSGFKTSDSDFSDTEGGKTAKLGVLQGRLRQAALLLFLNIVKSIDKRTIFSYWSSFIPVDFPAGSHTLTTCILKDPSPKGRVGALNVLLLLLTNSKLYLCYAENNERVSSFTSFSFTLGNMIKELHKCLILALSDNSIPVLTQALKCFAVLVQATPYHRLLKGLVTKLIRNVKVHVYHRDATVQVAALIVMGCLLSSEPVVPETAESFLRSSKKNVLNLNEDNDDLSEDEEEDYESSPKDNVIDISQPKTAHLLDHNISWLLEKCLSNLGVSMQNVETANIVAAPVKLESLQLISAMSRNYFGTLMAPHILLIANALNISLSDKYSDLRLHAGRAVDFIGQAMNVHFNADANDRKMSVENGIAFWQTLLNSSLIALVQNEQQSTLRAVGCDCLGSMGSYIFDNLPREKQILIITLLFSCTHDEENNVKGAAARALGVCVLYSSLKEDVGFIFDAAERIQMLLRDENMMVRIKASWSLGNLSDSLVLNRSNQNISEDIPNALLLKLLQESIKGCSDNDKIRMNTVRALGNLLQLVTSSLLEKAEFMKVTAKAIDTLLKNATTGSNMKVRWNSCYALGNVMKNRAVYCCNEDWQGTVFPSLSELVISFKNFKVRINSALALSSPQLRTLYGQHYGMIWRSLLKALENSENIEDFNEYKHRDHLIEQICLTLGHLTTLLTTEDLLQLEDCLNFHSDCLKTHMHRVFDRMVPEKSSVLYAAGTFVSNFITQEDISQTQKNVLRLLIGVFVHIR